MKKYRIIKEDNHYYLQKKRWFGWGYVYRASPIRRGYMTQVYSHDIKLVKQWLDDVIAGRIDPNKPNQTVIEEFEA